MAKFAHLLQHADRMDVAVLGILVGAGAAALRRLAFRQLLPPRLVAVGVDLALDAVEQLLQHRLAVADDRDIDVARGGGDFLRADVDAGDLRIRSEARRRGVADDVVHPRAQHDDQVGVAERRGAHRQVGARMIVRHHAAALRGGVERDAGGLDECLHLGPGARPDHAGAGHDQRLLRLAQRLHQRGDLARIAERAAVHDRAAGVAPIDQVLVDLLVEHVAGAIDVDRAGLAGDRLLQREVDLLRNALQVQQAIDVLVAAAHQLDLVDLLEHLAAELADRARAAERHDRAAIDQRVGHAGDQVGHAGTGRRHADARHLLQPAIGLAHERRRLLVADIDHADAFLDAGRLGSQHRAAHDVEDVLDAFLLQAPGDDFAAVHFCHLSVSVDQVLSP